MQKPCIVNGRNIEANATVPIVQTGVNFERKIKPQPDSEEAVEPPLRGGVGCIGGGAELPTGAVGFSGGRR
jgi:hypothetical protein